MPHASFPSRPLTASCKREFAYHQARGGAYIGVAGVVELEEGPRMMTNIVGEDALQVAIGDAVSVVFEQREGYSIPQFRRRK